MVDQLRAFASEVTRVAREVGTEGKLGGQAYVQGVAGVWKDLTDNVNFMASNLTGQVRNIAQVTTAVANGDLSKKITVDVKGEILELKNTINTMVDQLNSFASEVTRVAREVGSEGRLGGQAQVKGVGGTWKDLTDNVNFMAGNLTNQVRGIAKVVTSVATGDLKQKLAFEAKGEIAALADTINGMIDTLATFADQVTTVAREVGVEGKLGGQALVPGASGTWKGLTDNVNQLAANLTTQVRAIAEVASAVTKGDLTRSIQVDAQGEVEALKDTINQMIVNLRETTLKNAEQDWLKTNLAKFTQMLQGQKDLLTVTKRILAELAPVVAAQHGVFYLVGQQDDEPVLKLMASYAYKERRLVATQFKMGEGLVGQCALEKERILLTNVPPDYIMISSGLGEAPPMSIIVLPVIFEGQVKAVIELASFERFNATHQTFLEQLTESIGIVLNTIEANMRTEDLLKQSQSLAQELQSQQEELQQTNEELEEKAKLLVEQNAEVERKNREVEQAKQALEEKASQLALTSKYKSEFLANMSHELRTPLNSLLILAQQLADNVEGNLHAKQIQFAQTIYSAGSDLLTLINDILDLSKIESGTVTVEPNDVSFTELRQYVERTFRHMADNKNLDFHVAVDEDLPSYMNTDVKRLQQVIKNLLSNAFKFTDRGHVDLKMVLARGGWSPGQVLLNRARHVVAFSVSDTGIGIHPDKQQLIFEAFQQADGTTSRKYGGTGLGLSISREIARLLGGEIKLKSALGEGSSFTLYLPLDYKPLLLAKKGDDGQSLLPPPETRREAQPVEAYVKDDWQPREMQVRELRPAQKPQPITDDREAIKTGDQVVMIVEDDANFSYLLLNVAREKGFKGIVVPWGNSVMSLAREYQPDAITLDLHLPDMDGWSVLARLKEDAATRHIPVHIISVDEEKDRGLRAGALSFLNKPATKESLDESFGSMKAFIAKGIRNLLVVEDNADQRTAILELVADPDVEVDAVGTGAEALAILRSKKIDCMVMDLGLPDMDGFAMIEEIKKDPDLREVPIVVYTGKDLTTKQEAQLREVAQSIIIKDVRSPERLLDETALFLHRVQKRLPEHKRKMLEQLHQSDALLHGKKVLVVDDDIRNIFAMTSLLERHGMEVITAENGKDAVQIMQKGLKIDAVLMDIMMPEMDGYDTMRAIRRMPQYQALPIVALTAKAMKGDREKCIEAGASDYISKPVDTDQLLSLLRVWVYR
jgi:CheY-like chemotaxis protein/signal transduction histidine kinase/HAMP domain-containing protein